MKKIKIGIAGYGNLGRGVEASIRQNPDTELAGVFTRRDPAKIRLATTGIPVIKYEDASKYAGNVDIMILCGGSATDLDIQGPEMAKMFNTVDSFDTHAVINDYFRKMNEEALHSNHVSIISVGWDPGMFSINRLYNNCILPEGNEYTFWGPGVSQGHSDAIRRIKGVRNAKQYTLPVQWSVESVRKGENPSLTTRHKHTRICYVVAEEGADLNWIENEIVTMPYYFSDYDTSVKFISGQEYEKDHMGLQHGGFVIRSGHTGLNGEEKHIIEYSLKLGSNPGFTSGILIAYARAAYRLSQQNLFGAKTVFDISPALLSPFSGEELRAKFL